MPRVLVADEISARGTELLRSTPGFEVDVRTGLGPAALAGILAGYDALIVRSATRVTAEALSHTKRLRVIGRAGTGVDNVDLPAATRAGVLVMNTPGGNSVAAAELTLALVLGLARHIAQANAELREGRWERKRWVGMELAGKALGVLGLGRIGREVARRAQGLRMEVLGHDPYVSAAAAADLGLQHVGFDELLARADVVTLHLPLTDETRHCIGAAQLARMKPGARLVNCARGGLVDETALLAALESGHLAGAALDVFEHEPPQHLALLRHPHVVSTPHLGASTAEAQERVGVEIAEKIRDYLQTGVILDAVNFPSIARAEYQELAPLMDLAERLASFAGQIADGGPTRLALRAYGAFGRVSLKPLAMAAAKGLLRRHAAGEVSFVNALDLLRERGVTVEDGRSTEPSPYAGLLRLTLDTERGRTTAAGTLIAANQPRLVEIDGLPIEACPAGHLLVMRNRDVPGVVGRIGTELGQAGVNIAGLQLGRVEGQDRAVSILSVDGPIPRETVERIRALENILFVRAVQLPGTDAAPSPESAASR